MQFFGLTLDKLFLLIILAAILLGPKRLPVYAKRLAQIINRVRSLGNEAKKELSQNLDVSEISEIKNSLKSEVAEAKTSVLASTTAPAKDRLTPGQIPPYDAEAT